MVVPLDGPPSLKAILYMIHHVFLPPKTPQKDDTSFVHEKQLLETISNALCLFKDFATPEQEEIIGSVRASMDNLKDVQLETGAVNEDSLQSILQMLPQTGTVSSWCPNVLLLTASRRVCPTLRQSSKCRAHHSNAWR